jgi:D-alanyl-D-alanine carboxypeptidase
MCAAPTSAEDPWQNALEAWRDELNITGIQATVILADGRTITRTGGVAHENATVEPDTVFETGSITKSYTAALALRLVEQGAMSLDGTVGELLPTLQVEPRISLRQLLNHTSGLYNVSSHPGYLPAQLAEPSKAWTPEDNLAFLDASYFPPGAGWRYSNTNYIIAGLMIEAAAGETVGTLLRREILEPEALRHTLFGAEHSLPPGRAHAFIDIQGDDEPEDITAAMPATAFLSSAWTAGAVLSTSAELALWMRRLHSGQVLEPESYREMTRFVARPDGMQYGLGVLRMERDGELWLGHKGNSAGFSGAAWHLPTAEVTVSVLTNAHLIDVQPITDALVAVASGRTPLLPQLESPRETMAVDRMRSSELAAAAGALLADERAQDAIEVLEKAIELEPDDPDLRALLGDACVKAISPGSPVKAFKLGKRAQAEYQIALDHAPQHLGARMGLLRFYLGAPAIIGGSTGKALEQAEILEGFDKKAAWHAYKVIYAHLGETAKAAEYEKKLSTLE